MRSSANAGSTAASINPNGGRACRRSIDATRSASRLASTCNRVRAPSRNTCGRQSATHSAPSDASSSRSGATRHTGKHCDGHGSAASSSTRCPR
ncbi:MAG: hypothetical protein H6705_01375 [Myxococcales bacterium]|nr:hypothetical protein [Myxococcales bacterium]